MHALDANCGCRCSSRTAMNSFRRKYPYQRKVWFCSLIHSLTASHFHSLASHATLKGIKKNHSDHHKFGSLWLWRLCHRRYGNDDKKAVIKVKSCRVVSVCLVFWRALLCDMPPLSSLSSRLPVYGGNAKEQVNQPYHKAISLQVCTHWTHYVYVAMRRWSRRFQRTVSAAVDALTHSKRRPNGKSRARGRIEKDPFWLVGSRVTATASQPASI